MLGSLRLSIR